MEFSGDVIVDEDGSPQLLLETGAEDRAATFYTGNGTSVLTFRSTVQVGVRARFLARLSIPPSHPRVGDQRKNSIYTSRSC